MLKIVDSGVDPIDSYSRWWKVEWYDDKKTGEKDLLAQVILKCSIAHCCTLAAIQNVYITYGTKDYEPFFKQLYEFLKEFEHHRSAAVVSGLTQTYNPLWEPKTWVYFNSHQERIDSIIKVIPTAKIVHSFKNTAHAPFKTVHQIMFEV